MLSCPEPASYLKDAVKDAHGTIVRQYILPVLQMIEYLLQIITVERIRQRPQCPRKKDHDIQQHQRLDPTELLERGSRRRGKQKDMSVGEL